jgi:hypothetical protein
VHTTAYRETEAIVLGIGPEAPAGNQQLAVTLDLPFPLLSDPAGEAAAKQGLHPPAVVVTNRFGEIWAAWAGGDGHALPDGPAIQGWLDFIELQCPECGVAEWPGPEFSAEME